MSHNGVSRVRWTIEGVAVAVAEGLATVAFLLHRRDAATVLFVSGLVVAAVELIYLMNRLAGRTLSGAADSGWSRGNTLAGALLGWGFALVLLALGVYHLIWP